jgi:hypothetical protein
MKQMSLERMLEDCLQEMARTGDVEEALRLYPQRAGELRPLLQAAMATARHHAVVAPPPGGLAAGRARFLAAAGQQRPAAVVPIPEQQKERPMGFRWMTRWAVIALVAVIATMAAGGGVAAAAADSLPGAWLYPVKLAVEDVRLEFAAGPTAQAEMALHLADERLAEMEALVQNGQPVPEQVTLRMERHLQRALEGAAQAPEPQMLALLAQIAERTQTQLQVLERVRSMAPQAAQQGLERAWQACQQSHNAAAQGLDDPQTFRWHHQHREGAPDEVQPPVPPTVAPPGGGAQPGGPAPTCTPGAGPQQDRQRDQQQDRTQDQTREQDRTQEQAQEQQRTQERPQDQQGMPTATPQGAQNQNGPGPGSPMATPQGGQGAGGPQGGSSQGPQPTMQAGRP